MRKLYKLDIDENLKVNKNLINFLSPEYICLPVTDFDFFEEKDRILKNQIVLETSDLDYTSSISGNLSKLVNVFINNKKYDALLIKNNYKELSLKNKVNKSENLEDFLKLLNKDNLFKILNNKNVKNIVVNGIEDEPYTYTESFVLRKNMDTIYDTLEYLNKIYQTSKNYITLKNNESENINKYLNTIGSYPGLNVLVLENLYLIGKNEFLLEKLDLNEKETIVLKPSEILEISNYIKYGYPKTEKYITLVDLNENKISVINTKKYVLVCELIYKYIKHDEGNVYIKNGLMSGIEINPKKEVVDYYFNSLIITKENKEKERECLNCGKCYEVCPYKKNRCIGCSLCSYFCPSNISINKDVLK